MDTSEADPYEQQLRALFESFDSDNDGNLDHKGLQLLCEQLPLDPNQSIELINALLNDTTICISFSQFWDGLLTLLGGGRSSSCVQGSAPEKVKEKELSVEREESPEREVSPKLVLGQKKYGRRSRPESSELEFDPTTCEPDSKNSEEKLSTSTSSSLNAEGDDEGDNTGYNAKKRRTSGNQSNYPRDVSSTSLHSLSTSISQGSFSQAEDCLKHAWQQYGKSGFVNQREFEQVCECIGMEKLSSEMVQQLFDQVDTNRDGKVSLDDFLLLFHSGVPCAPATSSGSQGSWVLGGSALSGGASLSLIDVNGVAMASADAITEIWDTAGVSNPSLLLRDLNMDDSLRSLSVSSVACALEEEVMRQGKADSVSDSSALPISAGPSIYTNNLLLAALALRQAEVRWMRSSMEQMSCERDKLRNDLAEANCRASLLAQEIDDHHSKLEKVSQNQFKMMELKHAETIRDLTLRFSQEREQLAQQSNRLEKKVSTLQQSESKLSTEAASLRLENETLEQESRNLAERVAECEEAKLQMEKELQEIENLQQRLSELQANQEEDRIEHLCEQISKLRSENSSLRDRNDELTVELEVLTTRLSNMRVRRPTSSCVDGGLKRRGNSPLDVAPTDDSGDEESPRIGKVRRCSQKGEISLDNVHIEGLQIHPLGTSESGVEADLDVDSSENLSAGSIGKLAGNNLHLEGDHWLNLASQSSSLVGSQDDLINLPSCDVRNSSEQNADVPRLQARIEELERALHLRNSNYVGSQDVKQTDVHGLKEIEVDAAFLNKEDTPTCNNVALKAGSACDENVLSIQSVCQAPSEEALSTSGQAVEQLQQHCRDLESQLDNVKVQIVKILSEKRDCSKENCILKKRISDLRNQLPYSCTDLDKFMSATPFAEAASNVVPTEKLTGVIESSLKVDKAVSTNDDTNIQSETCGILEDKLKVMEIAHANELTALRDQCSDLEKSLAMMRDEYERCEDYWAGKLDEERHLAEQEQRITDEKFSELMSKIREYEDLFADDHLRRSGKPLDGRLETIEEQDGLEKQVMELEEEMEEFRCQAEMKLEEKEQEIQKLKDQLQFVQHTHLAQSVCSTDIAVQVSDLETGSWGSDRTFVVKPRRALNEDGLLVPDLNGNTSDNVLSSTSSTSSSGSAGMCSGSDEDPRDTPGAVRHHGHLGHHESHGHGRHRRIRHHPHYVALNCLNPEDELQAAGLRLQEQEQTCLRLQRALRTQQQQTQTLLQHAWDRHKQEVTDLQIVLQCTQEKLEQQGEICRDQMNRLTRSDILVKELYVENAHLLASIQNLEERCLILLQQQASIGSADNNCSSV